VRGLDLDHDAIVDYQVETLLAKLRAFVHHADPDLASHLVPTRQQLALQSLEVEVLEEAVSERVVSLEKRTDDGVNQLFENLGRSAHVAQSQVELSRPSSFCAASDQRNPPWTRETRISR